MNFYMAKRPPNWSAEFRIIDKHERFKCSCGKMITVNGVASHSKICSNGNDTIFKISLERRRQLSKRVCLEVGRTLAFSKFYDTQAEAQEKHDQYVRVKRKIRVRHICQICRKISYSRGKTCSTECAYKLMSKNMDYKSNGKKISKTRIELGCGVGKPSWNSGVYGTDYWDRIKRLDETPDDVRTRICQNWFTKTTIEEKIETLLQESNLEYQHNRFINRRSFDFVLPIQKIVIECDGDYWHGNPDKFPNLSDRQILKQLDDRLKDQIVKDYGYMILRFWESDIRTNLSHIKTLLLGAISGDEKSIYEIEENYTSKGGKYIRRYSSR